MASFAIRNAYLVVVFCLFVAVVGLTSQDAQTVRGVYLVMEPAAWWVLVPLSFASLVTGVVQSLGTRWGLFRHYWVLFKFAITLYAVVVLVQYMETFGSLAEMASLSCRSWKVLRSTTKRKPSKSSSRSRPRKNKRDDDQQKTEKQHTTLVVCCFRY